MTRPIFFLTDFGLADTYVGVVKAVILGIAPEVQIVDLTHDVPAQDIRAGAFALLTAWAYLPSDAVVLAVVDPGVGTARRPAAVQVGGRTFVGPDNGLLSWVIGDNTMPEDAMAEGAILRDGAISEGAMPAPGDAMPAPGGAMPAPGDAMPAPGGAMNRARTGADRSARARFVAPSSPAAIVLDQPRFWLPSVSATFHGRDLFGPVAAHVARGVPLADLGSPCDALMQLPFPAGHRAVTADGRIASVRGEILHIDRYGNLISNLGVADLPDEPVVQIAGRTIAGLSPHFQPGGAAPSGLIALIGSAGLLEIAVPNGSAAGLLGVGVGATLTAQAG